MTLDDVNNWIAAKATKAVGTMWCVYIFAFLTVSPIFFPSISPIVQYVSSAFLQLIFLPLIMVGQSVLGKEGELRAQQDHEVLLAEFKELKELHHEVRSQKKCPHLPPE
jgi:hypothetical protein